jgi:hypothetical protein
MPPLDAVASMTLEQQPMRLHHPIDPLDVDRRPTLFPVSSPDQGVNPPIAVSRQAGDDLLDLGQQFRILLWPATAPLTWAAIAWTARFERAFHAKSKHTKFLWVRKSRAVPTAEHAVKAMRPTGAVGVRGAPPRGVQAPSPIFDIRAGRAPSE